MSGSGGFRAWLRGENVRRTPRDDEMVEVAWLPLWQAQLVSHGMWERGIPNAMSEDHTSHLRGAAQLPMGRIFVLGLRYDAALAAATDLIGDEPITQHR